MKQIKKEYVYLKFKIGSATRRAGDVMIRRTKVRR